MSLVDTFTHLKEMPKADQALAFLQRVASLVKPIMRNHGWRLPLLAEFFPDNASLLGLNVNGGQKILLRLRPAHSPDRFYDDEEVIGTMLHELTHNVHGPHDDAFYKYLKGLEEEYYELRRKGYSGEGFHTPGQRLGQGVSHNLPQHIARQKALEAAEKRVHKGRMMGSGGRLGGSQRTVNKSPRELAAEAAERRSRDEKSCASGNAQEADRLADIAADLSEIHRAIEMTGDWDVDLTPLTQAQPQASSSPSPTGGPPSSSSSAQIPGPSASASGSSSSSRSSPSVQSPAIIASSSSSTSGRSPASHPSVSAPPVPDESNSWGCEICTLINKPLALQCDACGSERTWKPTPTLKQAPSRPTNPSTRSTPSSTSTSHQSRPRPSPPLRIQPQVSVLGDPRALGWTCHFCGEGGMEHQFWTCRVCGTVKLDSSVAA